ncbi:hypothetical protein BCR42DRAFT_440547 [Absidia repens]|uniref:Phosphodiesterase n=1 Tax=Absidia repens TaxID=90262 RepID=A0A1X2I8A0_9FUNG|nr:hypothetical protein BCR42DRAFT_440547 [Absidia repens]
MLILRHNTLSSDELFQIERKLLKANSTEHTRDDDEQQQLATLDFNLHGKSRADIYGLLLVCFQNLDLLNKLGWTPSVLLDFFIDVDQGYHPNAYHSFHHAVDVTLVLYYMVQEFDIVYYLSPIDIALLFIAGLCHDIGHPGLNNNYQVNMKTNLACQYNNHSVLESYSCSLALDLVEKHRLLTTIESCSHQQGDTMTEREAKLALVKMILATDMIFHYELQENMAAILDLFQPDDNNGGICSMTHKHIEKKRESISTLSSSDNSKNNSTDTTTLHTEGNIDENQEVTFVTPHLRDIFANLGENSPLLYFLERYNLNTPCQDQPSTPPSPTLGSPVITNAKVPPNTYIPTPFPSLSSSSSSSSVTDNTATTIKSHTQDRSDDGSEDHDTKKRNSNCEPSSPLLPPQQPNVPLPPQTIIDNTGGLCLGRDDRLILCQTLLHAADISNPLRPWPICYIWSQRVCTEFFHQGDMERMNGLPNSPNMDRQKTNQLTVGLQFSDYVVSPYFEIFAALFPKADTLLELLKSNRLRWLDTIQNENKSKKRRWSMQQKQHQYSSSADDEENGNDDTNSRISMDQEWEPQDAKETNQNEASNFEEEDDYFDDYDHIPDPLVPAGVLNPSGRRVSVAAGMAVIPNDLEKRTIGTGSRRRVYWGIRSASYADAIHHVKSHQQRLAHHANHSQRSSSLGGDHLMRSSHGSEGKFRRNSEQNFSPSLT